MSTHEPDEQAAVAAMTAHEPPGPGLTWSARRHAVPGWYVMCTQDAHGMPTFGGVALLGPDHAILHLSSNPSIHGWADTQDVLTELGDKGLDPEALVDEIGRRTAARRQREHG